MTAMAERVIEEIRGLPPAALREVCEAVSRLAAEVSPAPSAPEIRPQGPSGSMRKCGKVGGGDGRWEMAEMDCKTTRLREWETTDH